MNKFEANLSLFIITVFASVQYVFLAAIPESASYFSFLCITNLLGLIFVLVFFRNSLCQLDGRHIIQSLLLGSELFGFNIFLLLGSRSADVSVVSCVLNSYFVFIPIIMLLLKQKICKENLIGAALALIGIFFVMDVKIENFAEPNILFLIIADIFFAAYIITVERITTKASPPILAMGQMLFCCLFALIAWCVEMLVTEHRISFVLPSDVSFWVSVLFISVFIRGIYSVIQIYAQRYVTSLNISVIFATEVVMTLLLSPLLVRFVGGVPYSITYWKLFGCVIIVIAALIVDGSFVKLVKLKWKNNDV